MFTLQERPNPLAALLGNTVGGGLTGAVEGINKRKKNESRFNVLDNLSKAQSPLEALNAIERSNLDAEDRQMMWKMYEGAQGIEEKKKKAERPEFTPEEFAMVEKHLGKEAAELFKVSTPGGRTEIVKKALESMQRGNEFLKKTAEAETSAVDQAKHDEQGKLIPQVGPPKGLTPKERVDWSKDTRKENLPIFQEAQKKVKSWNQERPRINILRKISPKLPTGMSKLIFNPMTGEPWEIARLVGAVPSEVVRWVKTINDFSKSAKDSYGARVTNFDLQQFFKRYPSAMDTPEAREQILRQMELVGELDQLYEDALQKIYKKYGVGNITPEHAAELAEESIGERQRQIEEEVSKIGEELESSLEENFDEMPSASAHTGETLVDDEGNRWISDGKEWIKQ